MLFQSTVFIIGVDVCVGWEIIRRERNGVKTPDPGVISRFFNAEASIVVGAVDNADNYFTVAPKAFSSALQKAPNKNKIRIMPSIRFPAAGIGKLENDRIELLMRKRSIQAGRVYIIEYADPDFR